MLIEDELGNQLLELLRADEEALSTVAPLTHSLVVVRHGSQGSLLVFDRYKQYWELAGGMIEPGETARACAIRELQEESGLVCSLDSLRFVGVMKFRLAPNWKYSDVRLEYGGLYALEIDQIPAFAPNDEISAVCWWDGLDEIGQISIIDRKLNELAWEL